MASRAEPSGIRLTDKDAALVKGMLARGDRQHDVAAWFGVNGGRVADVANGKTHQSVKAASQDLPPKGPYLSSREAYGAIYALQEAQVTLKSALDTVNAALELVADKTRS
jgi:hypothetical protein